MKNIRALLATVDLADTVAKTPQLRRGQKALYELSGELVRWYGLWVKTAKEAETKNAPLKAQLEVLTEDYIEHKAEGFPNLESAQELVDSINRLQVEIHTNEALSAHVNYAFAAMLRIEFGTYDEADLELRLNEHHKIVVVRRQMSMLEQLSQHFAGMFGQGDGGFTPAISIAVPSDMTKTDREALLRGLGLKVHTHGH